MNFLEPVKPIPILLLKMNRIFTFIRQLGFFSCLSFLSCTVLLSDEPSDQRLKALYNSLDPYSLSQHLAFYELYSHYPIGHRALEDAWKLLTGMDHIADSLFSTHIPSSTLDALINLVNKPSESPLVSLEDQDLERLEKLSSRLAHTKIKGHYVWSEEEVLALAPHEIDLARGLFLSQFGSDPLKIRSYEALIDLMALQILMRLSPQASAETKIREINRFIFDEMGFRFPPHSLYAKDIDVYTFLPSVLDSHRGVCLGVSILYLCLAQRLNLSLEMITPPGHIYVRYRNGSKTINIETTARGVHIDSEEYLSISTRSLQQRTIKEVIGLAHVNQASTFLQQGEYSKALETYQKASLYVDNDPLIKQLLGFSYLFNGQKEQGERVLKEVVNALPDHVISPDTLVADYLNGNIDADSIKVLFKHTEKDRKALLEKKQATEAIVRQYPRFRAGLLHLASTWIELHRLGEALNILKLYNELDQTSAEVNYYLTALYLMRHDYLKAWDHLNLTESILQARDYHPEALKELRRGLATCCPE